jgi:hypothetical protein
VKSTMICREGRLFFLTMSREIVVAVSDWDVSSECKMGSTTSHRLLSNMTRRRSKIWEYQS